MRSLEIWVGSYLRGLLATRWGPRAAAITDVLFCVVDHFEPISFPHSTVDDERRRMRAWIEEYPRFAERHSDSAGVPPQHTWFYPGEAYRAEYLDGLNQLVARRLGEIELHLHHGFDTADSLRARIEEAVENFSRHGALVPSRGPDRRAYAFIHGNMALDNSMNDPRLCGVNNELQILQETGCYADFSLPTAPAISQTKKINSIYYAVDDPALPKSHNTGVDARVGVPDHPGLLIAQGPLALNWRRRKFGLLPRIDNGEVMGHLPATPDRLRRWVAQRIHVKGRPEWVVVKVSCHGAEERHMPALFGDAAHRTHALLEAWFRDTLGCRLHYVTARELYNIVKAAEAGRSGNPGTFRDFQISPPLNRAPAIVTS